MTESNEFLQFEKVAEKIYPQSRLLRAWNLTGGVSAVVTALEIALPGGSTEKVVMRRYGQADLASDSAIAAHEFELLQTVKAAGVPVPTPLYFDQSGKIFPTPFIVIEFVEGKTEFDPMNIETCLGQMAGKLGEIHQVNISNGRLDFLPDMTRLISQKLAQPPVDLDDSLEEGRLRAALKKVWPLSPMNPKGLIHGDYWPGNIMWQGEQLAAIIDWEDAKLGDPLADFASTRLEILFEYGLAAMEIFTRHYQATQPDLDYTNLGYWELAAALRPAGRIGIWAGNPDKEKTMRERHKIFVTQAFERIGRF